MKDLIEYYYNLVIDKLFIEDDKNHFILNNHDFYFVYFSRTKEDLEDILFVSNELKQKGINVHNIKLNINNSYLTKVDGIDYVLLEVFNKDEIIDIFSMNKYNKKLSLNGIKSNLYRNNWAYLWSVKVDYIESQLNEIQYDKIIDNSIDYYIGLSENAIQLYINKSEVIEPTYGYLEHYTNNYDTSNYLSPLNIRKVNIGNLFGKYIKYKLYNSSFSYKIINEIRLMIESKIDKYMLLATLMFQEEFFDEVKKIITSSEDKKNENVIQRYLSKVSELENILRYVQNEIVDEQIINWLEE